MLSLHDTQLLISVDAVVAAIQQQSAVGSRDCDVTAATYCATMMRQVLQKADQSHSVLLPDSSLVSYYMYLCMYLMTKVHLVTNGNRAIQ